MACDQFEAILAIIDKLDPPQRQRKLSNRVALRAVLHVLQNCSTWRAFKSDGIHYTTLQKRFFTWVDKGVFEHVRDQAIHDYCSHNMEGCRTLLTDCTMIKNAAGRDCLGRNHYDRSRLATKMSMICTTDRVPLAYCFVPANVNDVSTVDTVVERLPQILHKDGRRRYIMVGDKGYVMNDEKKASMQQKHRIKMVHPYRRNQTKKNTQKERALLRRRAPVEHVFCRLDKFMRLHIRRDHYIKSFAAFTDLALAILAMEETQKYKKSSWKKHIKDVFSWCV